MLNRNRYRMLFLFLATGTTGFSAHAQGFPPDEAPSKMTTPPGFHIELVAAEPLVRQPVAIEFDDRGRLWVVQYMQYPNPEGLERVSVDRYSRTTYDRMPEPPPTGPKGNDVITILEDKDGDGRMESAKNFVSGLNLCSGIALGYGGVFVLQVPYLLFYPDVDRDDVPDADPEVLVTGFGMEDAHSVANSLTWGPDGWLYGLQGSTVTAKIDGIEFQQGIWRYHPRTRQFELFAEGGGNMWGLDFNRDGHMFACTNVGGYAALHIVQGAYYWKQFGKHGALHNPYAYGYFDHCALPNPEGGHVVLGGTIYEADAYPEAYRGKWIVANLLTHNGYWFDLVPNGSTFDTHTAGEFFNSNDTWFAPSDMTLGPDGLLYVADWHDERTAHPDPDAEWDRRNGRVYRIAVDNARRIAPMDIAAMASDDLVDLLDHPNKWYTRRALVHLAERADASLQSALLDAVFAAPDSHGVVNRLFAAHACGAFDEPTFVRLLDHANPVVRRWVVRFIGDGRAATPKVASRLESLAATESDPHVRSQLAASAKRFPAGVALPLVWAMAQRDADADDPHIPLLLWWALEGHALRAVIPIVEHALHERDPAPRLFADVLFPRLVRRYAAGGSARGDAAALMLVRHAAGTSLREPALSALDEGLDQRGTAGPEAALGTLFEGYAAQGHEADTPDRAKPPAPDLRAFIEEMWRGNQDSMILLRLAARVDHPDALATALALAGDTGNQDRQIAAIEIVGRFGHPDAAVSLLGVFRDHAASPVGHAALDALRTLPHDDTGRALLALYSTLDEDMQSRVREALFTRAVWSAAFLDAVDSGDIDATDVPLTQLRVLAQNADEALLARLERHWGAVKPGTPEEKLAQMRRLNNELNARPGDPAKGREVFNQVCAQCHQFRGDGFVVGPDLTQSNRMDREYMLASMVDPNLAVRKEYIQYVVKTKDGGVFNGLIARQDSGVVELLNAKGVRTEIPAGDVADIREADASLMPEELITPLPGDDIRNLFAYLQSDDPGGASE